MKQNLFKSILLGVAICLNASGLFAQNINTVAGTGTAGYSGDGGAATSAQINIPNFLTAYSCDIYISDLANNRIRKVTNSTGYISTIAGTGTAGYSGDGGAATSATIHYPTGIAVDGSGNIYFADNNNFVVRKITVSTGIITTVAGNGTYGYSGDGGAATSAQLKSPTGVAVDASGNIYIADYDNQRIRKVTVSTGNISTYAGNGTAGSGGDGGAATSANLNKPYGIALDASGNLYIADELNHKIRKVTASTGNISTVAGTGTAGFSGDGAAATSAKLDNPRGVAIDGSSNIYIADLDNNRIRKVTASTGNISTYAGNGSPGFSGNGGAATSAAITPQGAVVNSSGTLYIVDDSRVNKITCPANAGVDRTIACNGSSTLGTSCSSNVTYSWAPSTFLSCTTCAQPVAHKCGGSQDQVITYTVTVSEGSCSSSTDQITVTYDGGIGCNCGDGPGGDRFANSGFNTDYNSDIIIYPNPSNGKIIIEAKEEMQSVIITDVTGRVVYKGSNITSNNYPVNLSKEPKGIYIVKIMQNGKEQVEKIIIE